MNEEEDHLSSHESPTGAWTIGLFGLSNIPLIEPHDDLATLIQASLVSTGFSLEDRDVVVVAQKIVSKAEGAFVHLASVVPSEEAERLAEQTGRDPRLCEVYLLESQKILGTKGRHVITRHRLGFIGTGAGVDRSNAGASTDEIVTLLPEDPDRSASELRRGLHELSGKDVAVIVSDSFGKPDREGSIGVAIGIAGIKHLEERQQRDLYGNKTQPSIALVDELAAAASLIMGQADESIPVVVIRGARFTPDDDASLQRLLVPANGK